MNVTVHIGLEAELLDDFVKSTLLIISLGFLHLLQLFLFSLSEGLSNNL